MKTLFKRIQWLFRKGPKPAYIINGKEYWSLGQHLVGKCGCGRHVK